MKKMKVENVILLVAALVVLISIYAVGFSYYSMALVRNNIITGFVVTTNASVNLTIGSLVSLNFTNYTINWGSGNVNPGTLHANLTTSSAGATIEGGTWSISGANGSTGFVLQNIGNLNLTVSLHTGKTAATFIGGTAPLYQYNVTNIDTDACLNASGGTDALNLTIFLNVNSTHPGTTICPRMQFVSGSDRVRVDIRLRIPYDSGTGTLNDTVSAAFSQAP